MNAKDASLFVVSLFAVSVSAGFLLAWAYNGSERPQNHITIHRTYSDIDGREVAFPAVYVVENGKETRHDGEVIARELPSGEWLIKVGGKEFRTRDKRESVTYFDLGPSPDNPGAIRS